MQVAPSCIVFCNEENRNRSSFSIVPNAHSATRVALGSEPLVELVTTERNRVALLSCTVPACVGRAGFGGVAHCRGGRVQPIGQGHFSTSWQRIYGGVVLIRVGVEGASALIRHRCVYHTQDIFFPCPPTLAIKKSPRSSVGWFKPTAPATRHGRVDGRSASCWDEFFFSYNLGRG